MPILPALATQCQGVFPATYHGQQPWRGFLLTRQAIRVPVTASQTSKMPQTIETRFGVDIVPSRYYPFMAAVMRRGGR